MSNYNTSYYKTSGPPLSRGRGGYSSGPMRGSPRGRGSSDGGGTWSSRGRGRGSYTSYSGNQSRGGSVQSSSGGQWYNKDSSQQSYRNDRYPSSSSRPAEPRYQSTRGGSTDYNRRYSRGDGPPSYSSGRDHHRSPDPIPRKRIRTDGGYPPASSRRSHDGGYEYSSSSRYEYGSDKGSYNTEDRGRPVYREERRPSADRRDDYHSPRSREASGSSMPPPSNPVRGTSYRSRGGTIRGRGVTRVFTRRPTDVSLAARKRSLIETYAAKRRILTIRSQDYYKKLKSLKLRSAAILSARKEGMKSEPLDSEDDAGDWDDEIENKDDLSENEAESKAVVEEEEGADVDAKKKKKVVRKIVKKVPIKKKALQTEDESEDVKDDPKDGETSEKTTENQLEDEGEAAEVEGEQDEDGPKMQVTIKQDSETRAVTDDSARKSSAKSTYRYMKLFCVHCEERFITFKDYQNHLRGLTHVNAMRKLSFRLKQNLARMRVEQRIKQRLDEKNDEARGVVVGRTNYCHTCKLNYRQERARHNESEMHKKMKEFLMPMCVICRINFRSPMLFENHICSLEHIKMEDKVLKLREREHHAEKEVDMDSLLVLDSVGSADESDSGEEAADDKSEGVEGEKKDKKKKAQINLGADYVKKVQVMYCELCGIYLPRTGEEDIVLANHCRTRNHLQRYVRYKDDRALMKEAARIHRRETAVQEARKAQEAKKETKSESSQDGTEKSPAKEEDSNSKPEKDSDNAGTAEGGGDNVDLEDKIWADVDQGLDELLREVEPGNKSSDDDDESGRYDRFRYSDKKGGKGTNEEEEAEISNSSLPSATDSTSKQEEASPNEK